MAGAEIVIRQLAQGGWVIALSFVVAFLLMIIPLPFVLTWLRPDWVSLVLIYWVIALPHRVGIFVAFCLGLLLDILQASTLGQNALSLSLVACLSLLLYQRLRLFNQWQQAAFVFIVVGINQIVEQWLQGLAGWGTQSGPIFLMPVVTSALLWPGIMVLLRYLRRRYRVV